MKSGLYGTIFEPKEVYNFLVKSDEKNKFMIDMANDIAMHNEYAKIMTMKINGIFGDEVKNLTPSSIYVSVNSETAEDLEYDIKSMIKKFNVNVVILDAPRTVLEEDPSLLNRVAQKLKIILISVLEQKKK